MHIDSINLCFFATINDIFKIDEEELKKTFLVYIESQPQFKNLKKDNTDNINIEIHSNHKSTKPYNLHTPYKLDIKQYFQFSIKDIK